LRLTDEHVSNILEVSLPERNFRDQLETIAYDLHFPEIGDLSSNTEEIKHYYENELSRRAKAHCEALQYDADVTDVIESMLDLVVDAWPRYESSVHALYEADLQGPVDSIMDRILCPPRMRDALNYLIPWLKESYEVQLLMAHLLESNQKICNFLETLELFSGATFKSSDQKVELLERHYSID